MHFKIEIPDEVIQKMISEKLDRMGVSGPQAKKKIIEADVGSFFKTVLEAAKRPRKDEGFRTGIRFKLDGETVETSLNTTTKSEVTEILKKHGVSISKFCTAALEVVIAEHKAKQQIKDGKIAHIKNEEEDPDQED